MPRSRLVPYTRQWVKGGVFGFRLQLPEDVVAGLIAIGAPSVKRTIAFSLKTRDPLAARSRALRAAADVGDLVVAVRSGNLPSSWPFDPTPYQRDGIVIRSVGQERLAVTRRADPDASTNAPATNSTTLHRVFETVYLPRRQERKGAVPRRRSRLDQEKAITRFVEMIGDKPIASITRGDAERFVRGLRVGSTATVKKTVNCLSTICNAAVASGLITVNPFRGLGPDRTAITASRRSYLRFDHDQLERLFDARNASKEPCSGFLVSFSSPEHAWRRWRSYASPGSSGVMVSRPSISMLLG